MTLASLRQEGWDVPPTIEELAGAVSLSQQADQAAARADARERGARPIAPRRPTPAFTPRLPR
jgi:hypothetical protein